MPESIPQPADDGVPEHLAEPASGAGEQSDAGPRGQGGPAADPAGRAQLAREALMRAKADSAARGNWPARPADRAARSQPGSTGRRPRLDDPQALNATIAGLIDARGWQLAAASTDARSCRRVVQVLFVVGLRQRDSDREAAGEAW